MNLLLVNPNTSVDTTALMLGRARASAPAGVTLEGATARDSAPLLVDPVLLARGAVAVERLAAELDVSGLDGMIIAAFGDPGLDRVRAQVSIPVTGIAEAAIGEAMAIGRFAIVTTTPRLVEVIAGLVTDYGADEHFRGCVLTHSVASVLAGDARALEAELEVACREAIDSLDPQVLIIGGGPLAAAAQRLSERLPVPVIEPVPAAVRLAVRRARAATN